MLAIRTPWSLPDSPELWAISITLGVIIIVGAVGVGVWFGLKARDKARKSK